MKRIILIIGWFTAVFLADPDVSFYVRPSRYFHNKNVFYGSDFLPAMWISPLVLVPLVLFILIREKKECFFLIGFYMHLHGCVR